MNFNYTRQRGKHIAERGRNNVTYSTGKIKGKVYPFTLEQSKTAQRGSRGIALLFV